MDENEKQKNAKSTFKLIIISMIAFLAIGFGVKYGYDSWQVNEIEKAVENDDSYKVITNRDKSYNGVYSLTKLDEKGNNTWDGLMLYVKDDKIIEAALMDYATLEEAKEKFPTGAQAENAVDFLDCAGDEIYEKVEKRYRDREDKFNAKHDTVALNLGVSDAQKGNIAFTINWANYYYDEVNLKTDYEFLNEMNLVPGYDEKSKEIWLSKLLKNKNSEYNKGYKLRKYKNDSDIAKNCKIDSELTMWNLNETYNAGLDES